MPRLNTGMNKQAVDNEMLIKAGVRLRGTDSKLKYIRV